MTTKNTLWLLITFLSWVIIIGTRLYGLSDIPPGIYDDEASIGLNALCIMETGKDEHGISYPIYFKAFGEYKNGPYIYSTIPFFFMFGKNAFALRLTSAFWSVLGIFFLFLFLRDYLNPSVARWGLAFCAVSPWMFYFSRISFEAISLPAMLMITLYCLNRARAYPWLLIGAATFGVVGMYCYAPGKLVIPLIVVAFLLIHRKDFDRSAKLFISASILALLLSLPLLYLTWNGSLNDKFSQLFVFNIERTFVDGIKHALQNLLSHFSWKFLVTKGDVPLTHLRHSTGLNGQISWAVLLGDMLGFGLIIAWFLKRPLALNFSIRKLLFILCWLIIGIMPASITLLDGPGHPHAIRSLSSAPAFIALAALATQAWAQRFSFIKVMQTILIITFGIFFFHNYFGPYKELSRPSFGIQTESGLRFLSMVEKNVSCRRGESFEDKAE